MTPKHGPVLGGARGWARSLRDLRVGSGVSWRWSQRGAISPPGPGRLANCPEQELSAHSAGQAKTAAVVHLHWGTNADGEEVPEREAPAHALCGGPSTLQHLERTRSAGDGVKLETPPRTLQVSRRGGGRPQHHRPRLSEQAGTEARTHGATPAAPGSPSRGRDAGPSLRLRPTVPGDHQESPAGAACRGPRELGLLPDPGIHTQKTPKERLRPRSEAAFTSV